MNWQQLGHRHPRLIDVRGEGRLARVVGLSTGELLDHRLLKTLRQAVSQQSGQGAHAEPRPLLEASTRATESRSTE